MFNGINRVGILWTVRHLWLSGDRFVFNYYCNWSSVVLGNGNGTASFLHISEGVTQGDHMTMIAYGIGIPPLIKNLKQEIPDVNQTWYACDARYLCMFSIIETYFNSLTHPGSGHGYYIEPPKSVLIVHMENLDPRKVFEACHGFKVCMGARYIRGYI